MFVFSPVATVSLRAEGDDPDWSALASPGSVFMSEEPYASFAPDVSIHLEDDLAYFSLKYTLDTSPSPNCAEGSKTGQSGTAMQSLSRFINTHLWLR